jgi:uncharacterized protein with FMN-binding domain
MKKALVTIFAVAILGALGLYANSHKTNPTSAPTSPSSNMGSGSMMSSQSRANYKDGIYTGSAADTPYGVVQVSAVVSGGKITDVNFLKMPFEEGRSKEISSMAEPALKQTALNRQSAQSIDFVSGATSTSYGYQESLQAALDKAKIS